MFRRNYDLESISFHIYLIQFPRIKILVIKTSYRKKLNRPSLSKDTASTEQGRKIKKSQNESESESNQICARVSLTIQLKKG